MSEQNQNENIVANTGEPAASTDVALKKSSFLSVWNLKKYVDCTSCDTRTEFWLSMLTYFLPMALLWSLNLFISIKDASFGGLLIIWDVVLFLLFLLIPFMTLIIRRLRDADASFGVLAGYIALGFYFVCFLFSYGAAGDIYIRLLLISIIAFLCLMCLPTRDTRAAADEDEISFTTALKWENYAGFSGCASRKEYWSFVIVFFALCASFVWHANKFEQSTFQKVLMVVALVYFAFPYFSVTVRRLRDIGNSFGIFLFWMSHIAIILFVLYFLVLQLVSKLFKFEVGMNLTDALLSCQIMIPFAIAMFLHFCWMCLPTAPQFKIATDLGKVPFFAALKIGNYMNFKGNATKKEYCTYTFFACACVVILTTVLMRCCSGLALSLGVAAAASYLVVPQIAVLVRRFNDIGGDFGWFVFMLCLVSLVTIVISVIVATSLISLISYIALDIIALWLCFMMYIPSRKTEETDEQQSAKA